MLKLINWKEIGTGNFKAYAKRRKTYLKCLNLNKIRQLYCKRDRLLSLKTQNELQVKSSLGKKIRNRVIFTLHILNPLLR
jgi:hypothetical protein